MESLYYHQLNLQICFQYSENNFRFCGKNLNCYKDSHVEKSYFPLMLILLWGTLWWIFSDIMIFKWEFWFFYPPSCDRPQQIPVFFHISWITYIRAVHCSSTGLFFFIFDFLLKERSDNKSHHNFFKALGHNHHPPPLLPRLF